MLRLLLPRRERLRREAADWLARERGGMSAAERRAFQRWYADPAHAETFDRLQTLYQAAGGLAGTALFRPPSDRATPSRARANAYALAAALAVAVVAGAAIVATRPAMLVQPASAETLYFATKLGEIRRVPLPDGTRMTLDTDTKVRVDLRDDVRQVTLGRGRVRLAVANDPKRPFVVRAGGARVTAGQTVFDVALRGDAASVHLLSGDATVAPAGAAADAPVVRLGAGESVRIPADGGAFRPEPTRSEALWPTGMLEFDGAPLGDVVAEANRYSPARIRVADPELAALRVTGTFRAGDAEALARSLSAAFGLDVRRPAPGVLVLVRREKLADTAG